MTPEPHAGLSSPKRRLDRLAFEQCVPLYVTCELSLRCNLRCAHCYNFDRQAPEPKVRRGKELGHDEWLGVIDAVADAGCLYLYLSGGEALLHPSLDALVERGAARHLRVTLKSNGLLLSADRARQLFGLGLAATDISLYGGSAATQDALTEKPGSFAAALAGIDAAVDAGLRVKVSYCVTRHNAHEVPWALAYAERRGVNIGFDTQLTARYDGTTSSLDLRVDTDQLASLLAGPLAGSRALRQHDPDRNVQCGCARSVCGIGATGEVYPCIGAPLPAGSLREMSFADIWKGSPVFEKIRGLRLTDFPSCAPCADRPWCRRSSGVVYNNTGDYTGAESFTCAEAAILHRLDESTPAGG